MRCERVVNGGGISAMLLRPAEANMRARSATIRGPGCCQNLAGPGRM